MKPFEEINLSEALEERPQEGVLRVDRSIFTDEDLFELEIERIWEKVWLFLGHEGLIPDPNDYFTTYMGRQPVVVTRDAQGNVNTFINACTHRGSMLVRHERGNSADFTCGFHGWCFSTSGDLMSVTKESVGGYPDQFDRENYGLTRVRTENYRGFIFATLNDEAESLDDYLKDAKVMIDLLADQGGDEGFEVLKGISTYTFDANWKLQAENGVDGYHVHQGHLNFALTTKNREKIRAEQAGITKSMDVGGLGGKNLEGGFFDFGNGHTMLWGDWPNDGDRRPNYHMKAEWSEKFGAQRAQWMISRLRNLLLYPNVFIMDQMSTQIRVFRPLAANKTEVTVYSIAPKNESQEMRTHRIRQYEDFFNATGMATPDDLAEFNYCQKGYAGRKSRWNDLTRGVKYFTSGSNKHAESLGLNLRSSGGRLEDEGIFVAQHQRWLDLMKG